VPVYAIQNGSSDEYLKRVEATLAVFEREFEPTTRHHIGAASAYHRRAAYRASFRGRRWIFWQARDDTVFVTSSVMGDWLRGGGPRRRDTGRRHSA
jgi:allantoinase